MERNISYVLISVSEKIIWRWEAIKYLRAIRKGIGCLMDMVDFNSRIKCCKKKITQESN